MFAPKFLAVTASILGLQIRSTHAIDLGARIIGCPELNCPADEDFNRVCRVANHSSTVIGLTNLNTSISEDDLTWTKGVKLFQQGPTSAVTYENNFYLGTPAGFDLSMNAIKSNYDACALFFIKVSQYATFDGGDIAKTTGTCSDALSAKCVDAILKRATDTVTAFKSGGAAASVADKCQELKADFGNNFDSPCFRVAIGDPWETPFGGPKWQKLHVQGWCGAVSC